MDLDQTPTMNDLAKMLDSIGTCATGEYPETLHVMNWLIERSPAAREVYDRLHARRHDGPSLIELARLMIAVETGEPYPEAVYTARWLIERSPVAAELCRRLERMAIDAGFEDQGGPCWAVDALEAREELDRLMSTLDDWQDATQAITLKMEKDYAFQCLLSVCRARIARSQGDERARLERLRRRLQAAASRHIRVTDPEAALSELQTSLRSMVDPAATLETVEALINRDRRREANRRT